MSWQWWLATVGFAIGLAVLVGGLVWDQWRISREERSQAVSGALTGATDEWADTLHGIRVHAAEAESLEDTANIDMSWLRTHLDMEDIEEELHKGLTFITEWALKELNDDAIWRELALN